MSRAANYQTFSIPESQRKAAIAMMEKFNHAEPSQAASTNWFTKLSNVLMHLW
ncbi:hypothetical protein [Methylobacterium pseudosasicola]|uniref:hypothetical protein n=1 Tax=Methylobacterium pseudosasicola TaxID=582667 RepID=UPI001428BE5F|nr:hypothetical protein [Methylobacterium pseudosasicola]